MCKFLRYLCPCCCCLCPEKQYKRDPKPKQKLDKLGKLNDIFEKSSRRVWEKTDPTDTHLTELTDVVMIPSPQYKTDDDVVTGFGFSMGDFINSGSFAKVYKATHIEKELAIACKKISLTANKGERRPLFRLKDIKNELYVLQHIRHPHIIQMLQHFIIMENNISTLYVFMQLADGGSISVLMRQYGKPFNENVCCLWFCQILNALVFMHEMGVAHRDLKLANLLLDVSHDVLVSDFGLSRIAYSEIRRKTIEANTSCGTPPFMAPELLLKKPYNAFAVDVWALGVVLYVLFNMEYPFPIYRHKWKTIDLMQRKKWSFGGLSSHSPSKGLKDILNAIFEPNPKLRPSLKALTEHFWAKTVYKGVADKSRQLTETYSTFRKKLK